MGVASTGALLQLAFPPAGLWGCVVVAFVPALVGLADRGLLAWAAGGLLAGLCTFTVAPLALVAWGWPLYLGLWWVSALLFSTFFALTGLLRMLLAPSWRWLAWPTAWVAGTVAAEVGAELPLSLSLALGLTRPEWLGAARLLGLPGIDFALALPSALIAARLTGELSTRACGAGLVSCAGLLLAGPHVAPPDPGELLRIAAVQPAISVGDAWGGSWSLATRSRVEARLDALTERALELHPDLVVWPEGGNELFNRRLSRRRERLLELAREGDAELLISGQDLTPGGELFSVVTHVRPDGFGADVRKARTVHRSERHLARGTPTTLATRRARVGVAICFEAIFASHMHALVAQGAELLAVVTDDSSFGYSPLQEWHLAFVVARAVEAGRALVLVGNRGISLATDPNGRLVDARWRGGRPDVFALHVSTSRSTPPAVRGGRALGLVCLGALLVWGLRRSSRARAMWASRAIVRPGPWAPVGLIGAAAVVLHGLLTLGVAAYPHGVGVSQVIDDARLRYAGTGATDGVAPVFRQRGTQTCGAAALAYLLTSLGDLVFEDALLRALSPGEPSGYSLAELASLAHERGFRARGYVGDWSDLPRASRPPVLAHLSEGHYVVVHEASDAHVLYFDPEVGAVLRAERPAFEARWSGAFLELHTLSERALAARESPRVLPSQSPDHSQADGGGRAHALTWAPDRP